MRPSAIVLSALAILSFYAVYMSVETTGHFGGSGGIGDVGSLLMAVAGMVIVAVMVGIPTAVFYWGPFALTGLAVTLPFTALIASRVGLWRWVTALPLAALLYPVALTLAASVAQAQLSNSDFVYGDVYFAEPYAWNFAAGFLAAFAFLAVQYPNDGRALRDQMAAALEWAKAGNGRPSLLRAVVAPYTRASRSNYIVGLLIAFVLAKLAPVLALWIDLGTRLTVQEVAPSLTGYFLLPALWVYLCLSVNRLHDLGHSGVWITLPFFVSVLVWCGFALNGDTTAIANPVGSIQALMILFHVCLSIALLGLSGSYGTNQFDAAPER
jgi:uncharacterized membrane protein YhaH (DUF805 family)